MIPNEILFFCSGFGFSKTSYNSETVNPGQKFCRSCSAILSATSCSSKGLSASGCKSPFPLKWPILIRCVRLRTVRSWLDEGQSRPTRLRAGAFAGRAYLVSAEPIELVANAILPRVYAQKLIAEIIVAGERRPMPLDWLDSFCMRNFTGSAEFDDTLPTGDGQLEVGSRVDPKRLAEAMSEWFTKRGKGDGKPVKVELRDDGECGTAATR